jgi:hypothetical protein
MKVLQDVGHSDKQAKDAEGSEWMIDRKEGGRVTAKERERLRYSQRTTPITTTTR